MKTGVPEIAVGTFLSCTQGSFFASEISWTTLDAHAMQKHPPITQRTVDWHDKPSTTFMDALALLRHQLWLASEKFSLSAVGTDTQELAVILYHRMVDSLAYAA